MCTLLLTPFQSQFFYYGYKLPRICCSVFKIELPPQLTRNQLFHSILGPKNMDTAVYIRSVNINLYDYILGNEPTFCVFKWFSFSAKVIFIHENLPSTDKNEGELWLRPFSCSCLQQRKMYITSYNWIRSAVSYVCQIVMQIC